MNDSPRREGRFTPPSKECPNPDWWTSEDDQATEDQVLDGLYGLVRLLQPQFVLETGSHLGFGTLRIAQAIDLNGHGTLLSVENDHLLFAEAKKKVKHFPFVRMRLCDSLELEIDQPIDFAWFDSGPGWLRYQEFERFFPMMHDRTVVAFHDTGLQHPEIRESVQKLMKRRLCDGALLPTPRGIFLGRVKK